MARIDIGELQVQVEADVGGYIGQMQRAVQRTEEFELSTARIAVALQAAERAANTRAFERMQQSFEGVGGALTRAEAAARAFSFVGFGIENLELSFPGLDATISGLEGATTAADNLAEALGAAGARGGERLFRDIARNVDRLGLSAPILAETLRRIGASFDDASITGDLQAMVDGLAQLTALQERVDRELVAGSTLFPRAAAPAEQLFDTLQDNFGLLGREAFAFQDALNQILTTTPPGDTALDQELLRLRQIEGLARQVEVVIDGLRDARTPRLVPDAAEAENFFDALVRIDGRLAGLSDPVQAIADRIRDATENARALDAALARPEGLRALAVELEDSERQVERLTSQFERLLSGELTPTGLQFELAGGTLERAEAVFSRPNADAESLNDNVDRLNAGMESLGRFGDAAGAAIGRAFADAIIQARSLGDVLDALVQTLVRAAATAFVGDPLSRLFGALAGRQFGGRVSAGQPVVVGEAGPEVFRPDAAGTVIPNGQIGAGGVTVVVNSVDAPELVEAAVRRALAQEVPGVVASTVGTTRLRRAL